MKPQYFRLNRLEKGSNNIIYFYPEQDELLTANDMLELLEILKDMSDGKPLKMMFVLQGKKLFMSECARKLYKTHRESRYIFRAQAAVFDSLTMQLLVDLLLRVYAPPYPLKVFRKVEDAERWLMAA